jgi:hypothetical protein
LEFKEISIDDQPLFNDFKYICSDYEFSYIYMYGKEYKLQLANDGRALIIRSDFKKSVYYMPLGDTVHGIKSVMESCDKKSKPVFAKIPEGYCSIFANLGFKLKEDRNSFDYIFRNSDFVKYEGKNFRKQRNNMSNYLRYNEPYYTNDVNQHIEECKAFVLKNYTQNDIIEPTFRVLDNLGRLNLKGGIVWNRGNIQAFCVYEKVSGDTILSHVELTDNSHRGVHAYMINEMSKTMEEEYINKEDDMGLSGLRRFKESYRPCRMLKKYTAYLE